MVGLNKMIVDFMKLNWYEQKGGVSKIEIFKYFTHSHGRNTIISTMSVLRRLNIIKEVNNIFRLTELKYKVESIEIELNRLKSERTDDN